MTRSPRLTALALVAVIALVPGCGGDDDDGTSKPRTSTADTTGTATAATTTPSPTPTTTTSKDAKSDPSAGRAVQAFFNSVSQRDGDAACRYLSVAMQQTAIRFIRRVPGNGSIRTCSAAVEKSVSRNTPAQLRTIRNVMILSSTAEGALATVKVQRLARDVLLTKEQGRWIITSGVFNSR